VFPKNPFGEADQVVEPTCRLHGRNHRTDRHDDQHHIYWWGAGLELETENEYNQAQSSSQANSHPAQPGADQNTAKDDCKLEPE
jgi:hypothetical protein